MKVATDTLYHKILRVALMVCAFVLIFESGLLIPATAVLSQNTGSFLANAVGVSVGVAPNELNTWTAALTEKEMLLAEREAVIAEREIAVNLNENRVTDTGTFVWSAIVTVLLALVIMNYVLDYLRAQKQKRLLPSL